jgi:hypothetical protein
MTILIALMNIQQSQCLLAEQNTSIKQRHSKNVVLPNLRFTL